MSDERIIDSLRHMIDEHRKATIAIVLYSLVIGIIFGSAIA